MMNANAHFTLHRESRWLYRLALICLLIGGGIVVGRYLGDGQDWFYGNGMVRYFVLPLAFLLLAVAPVLAWAARNNSLPALMLTDTALLYRATVWSSDFKGIRRDQIRSITTLDLKYKDHVTARMLQVHVYDRSTAMLGDPGGLVERLNRKFSGGTITIPCAGWPLSPEDVKARIETWIAQRN